MFFGITIEQPHLAGHILKHAGEDELTSRDTTIAKRLHSVDLCKVVGCWMRWLIVVCWYGHRWICEGTVCSAIKTEYQKGNQSDIAGMVPWFFWHLLFWGFCCWHICRNMRLLGPFYIFDGIIRSHTTLADAFVVDVDVASDSDGSHEKKMHDMHTALCGWWVALDLWWCCVVVRRMMDDGWLDNRWRRRQPIAVWDTTAVFHIVPLPLPLPALYRLIIVVLVMLTRGRYHNING